MGEIFSFSLDHQCLTGDEVDPDNGPKWTLLMKKKHFGGRRGLYVAEFDVWGHSMDGSVLATISFPQPP